MTTSVTGYLAGEGAAQFLSEQPQVAIHLDEAELDQLQQDIFAPLGKDGLSPKDVLTEIQQIMFPYQVSIIKNEAALQDALYRLKTIQLEKIPQMAAKDYHYLLKLREVRSVAFVSELYLRASLERRESRAGHYREDYPKRDDKYLGWLTITKGARNQMDFAWNPVPLDQYKYPVTRYYSDNFTFMKK